MDYDFLIIGGGIAGTSAGAQLAALGSVCLIEGEAALAYHASGRSAALYEANYGAPTTMALARASRDALETLDGGVLSPRGLMMLAGPEDTATGEADLVRMQLERITPKAAADLFPILNTAHLSVAGYSDQAWDIDTDRMVQCYAREIRAHGAVRCGAPVSAISKIPGGWTVRVGSDPITARTVVNAAGPWADQIAAMAGVAPIGITPLRRSMVQIPAPGGRNPEHWPMVFGAGERWYAKPDAGALIISPAEEDPVDTPHDAWADDMVLAEGIARYQPFVTEEVTRINTSWAGLRSFAPDRNLVLGRDPSDPAFIWCAGQGGYGFLTAPAASRHLADQVAGRLSQMGPEITAALSPARFA